MRVIRIHLFYFQVAIYMIICNKGCTIICYWKKRLVCPSYKIVLEFFITKCASKDRSARYFYYLDELEIYLMSEM